MLGRRLFAICLRAFPNRPTRRQSQRPWLSRSVLRAARLAPATVVAHLERWAIRSRMEARPLAISLASGTAVVWCALALAAPKLAISPLLGFIPLSSWDVFLDGPAFQFLLPIAIYL